MGKGGGQVHNSLPRGKHWDKETFHTHDHSSSGRIHRSASLGKANIWGWEHAGDMRVWLGFKYIVGSCIKKHLYESQCCMHTVSLYALLYINTYYILGQGHKREGKEKRIHPPFLL